MIIQNVNIYSRDMTFHKGDIHIQNGVFSSSAAPSDNEEIIDGKGCYAIPGLIDLHFHGICGYDFCDGTAQAFASIAAREAAAGITGIVPATMTLPAGKLEQILSSAAAYKKETEKQRQNRLKADLLGINMEGPFISPVKCGAQDPAHILPCDITLAEKFLSVSEGLVKIIGIAPEENPDYPRFTARLKDRVKISLAHTNADYETARNAFSAGADHAVHLYNAMSSFSHREPGVIGAAADSPHVYAELICDGIHVHPAAVRAAFKMLGPQRIVFISDSMRAAGMPDGRYTLGGLDVDVKARRATLVKGGALAGSASNLMDCLRTAVLEMGIPLETAVACASVNPAKCLGVYDTRGSIETGKKADLVLLDESLTLQSVIKDGHVLPDQPPFIHTR